MITDRVLKRNAVIYKNKVETYKALIGLINTTDSDGASVVDIIAALKYREELLNDITHNNLFLDDEYFTDKIKQNN